MHFYRPNKGYLKTNLYSENFSIIIAISYKYAIDFELCFFNYLTPLKNFCKNYWNFKYYRLKLIIVFEQKIIEIIKLSINFLKIPSILCVKKQGLNFSLENILFLKRKFLIVFFSNKLLFYFKWAAENFINNLKVH